MSSTQQYTAQDIDNFREQGIPVFSFRSLATNNSSWMDGNSAWDQIWNTVGLTLDNSLANNLISLQQLRNPQYLNNVLKLLTLQMLGFRWNGSSYLTEDIVNALLLTITDYYSRANAGSVVKNPYNTNQGLFDALNNSLLSTGLPLPIPTIGNVATPISPQVDSNIFYEYIAYTSNTTLITPLQTGEGIFLGSWDAEFNIPFLSNTNPSVAGSYYINQSKTSPTIINLGGEDLIFYTNDIVSSDGTGWNNLGQAPLQTLNISKATPTTPKYISTLNGYAWSVQDTPFSVSLRSNTNGLIPLGNWDAANPDPKLYNGIGTNNSFYINITPGNTTVYFNGISGTFLGTWDASTNTPTLSNSSVAPLGDYYINTASGINVVNFGAGSISFAQNDMVVSNGTVWDNGINGTVSTVVTFNFLDKVLYDNGYWVNDGTSLTPDYAFDLNGLEINGTLAKMISLIASTACQIIPLWTKDYLNFFTIDEITQQTLNSAGLPDTSFTWSNTIYSGTGEWYLSPHVELKILNSSSLTSELVSEIDSLFNYLCPITMVLERIYQLIPSPIIPIYVSLFPCNNIFFYSNNF